MWRITAPAAWSCAVEPSTALVTVRLLPDTGLPPAE